MKGIVTASITLTVLIDIGLLLRVSDAQHSAAPVAGRFDLDQTPTDSYNER
jgi:hypothetical protein